jgi:hypothetical protein
MELKINPEGLEIANKYLETQSVEETARAMYISEEAVTNVLNKTEVKRYIDSVYLDLGYRNRFKLGNLLDRIIDAKLEECEETEIYTNKDLVDLITLAHKMRMEELKHQKDTTTIRNQTNVQINESNPFGGGKYGELMEKLVGGDSKDKK